MHHAGKLEAANDRDGAPPARHAAATRAPEVRVVVSPAETAIDGLAADWEKLAQVASEPNAFAEHWFVRASLPTMASGHDVRLMEVRRGPRLIGLLPVTVEQGYARLPVRLVKNWSHTQMFLGTPLVALGEEQAFWTAILKALDAADWAPNFLHLRGIAEAGAVHRGLSGAARALGRSSATVHREVRAFLDSDLGPQAYYERAVRQKKRKEIKRLRNRLAELGAIEARSLADPAALDQWCDLYLGLEQVGWKGKAGSALADDPAGARFFRDAVKAAWAAGRLQFLRLDLKGQPIAMLVNFLTAPGSFSFKTVFDEEYARFSPGVLIQLENLNILDRPDIAWMDSCAVEDHPMIDSLWTERRAIVRVTIPLKGARRTAIFALCRALERASAALRAPRGSAR